MDSLSFKLDVIANNLANAGTTAFKRSRTNFEDIYYQNIKLPGVLNSQSKQTSVGIAVGLGTRIQSTELDMNQGSLLDSTNRLDLAIVGDGFFQINDGSGVFQYARAGNFSLNANGEVVLASAQQGRLLEPSIVVPQDAVNIEISADGIVSVLQQGQTQLNQIGQIQLVRFINPQGLVQRGENLYADVGAAGSPIISNPGVDGLGTIQQRTLEASNVEPVRELVDLISTQRNFELNSQVVQAADQALQLVNNLRRF